MRVFVTLVLAACVAPASALGAAPPNDDFANRTALEGTLPITATGTNVEATREWQYEEVGMFAKGHSVWFKWTADVDGWVTVDTCTASFQTVLGIFTGPDVEHLTRVTKGNASEMPGCFASGRKYTFKAVNGTEYELGVDGNGYHMPESEPPTEGEFTLRIEETPPPVNDNFASATTIPSEAEEEPDGTRRYSGSATGYNWKATTEGSEPSFGAGAGASVWYSWTPPETAHYRFFGPCCLTGLAWTLFSGESLGGLSEVLTTTGNAEATFTAGTHYRIAVYGTPDGETGEPSMGSFNLFITATLAPGPGESPSYTPESPPPPPVASDTTPPNTKIDKSTLRIAPRTATFWFSASEAVQGFLCRLDKGDYKPCGSPRTYKHLKRGRHAFRVKAVDLAGNVDGSPAIAHFRVPRPYRGRR